MDEPEAALSPQRQLSFLILLHDLLTNNDDIQFIIATHSPIILAYPAAQILSFDFFLKLPGVLSACRKEETTQNIFEIVRVFFL
jgi:predicted ATPase